eukprot:m.108597 g.108597  ORF g.108597 m.108597 type:complete len:58 (+) comp13350_c2_seq6:2098-2271(+)
MGAAFSTAACQLDGLTNPKRKTLEGDFQRKMAEYNSAVAAQRHNDVRVNDIVPPKST